MKVMVLAHPINEKCFEVLFSDDNGEKFVTVDGLTKEYIESSMGYTVYMVRHFPNKCSTPYKIMAKALGEKLSYLQHHVKYKDEYKYLRAFKDIGERLCDIESQMDWDLDIPEIVTALVNSSLTKPTTV